MTTALATQLAGTAALVTTLSTWALLGLVWTVQLLVYPAFARLVVHDALWVAHHKQHTTRITYIVAPLMFAELASAVALLFWHPPWLPRLWVWSLLGLTAVVWISTALVQVPLHNRLAAPDRATRHELAALATKLTASNWTRTAAWTLRAAFLALLWWRALTAF